jgi:hypothetical protein
MKYKPKSQRVKSATKMLNNMHLFDSYILAQLNKDK